ncbi:MAG: poly-gamma-glutamate system protein [Candidatus Lernaella stagnicola]|nr:poly-gamma-glutamate system protein [Candidatus Lernaella stagnicola]
MKRLYWRPQRVSVRALFLIAVVALAGLLLVEKNRIQQEQPFFKEKVQAARIAMDSFKALKIEAKRRGVQLDPDADPTDSYLIGQLLSSVTTNPGHLPAKQTTINPNFAALIVHFLRRGDVESGDLVAVGMSGSYPALNLCVHAALQAIDLEAIIISSTGSSQWGANNPKFLWPDMEKYLFKEGVFKYRSAAISRGGLEDRGLGLSKAGRRVVDRAIDRSGLYPIRTDSYQESVSERMDIYREWAAGREIKAYINVGGGTASVGARLGRKLFHAGLNRTAPSGVSRVDSVMGNFILKGVPVVHLLNIERLATRYGLPLTPKEIPPVGQGKIFVREVHNTKLAIGFLALIVLMLFAFVRLDWGYRIFNAGRKEKADVRPEKMV